MIFIENRGQKRDFIRRMERKGIKRDVVQLYFRVKDAQERSVNAEKIQEGTKVRIDVDHIKGAKEYSKLNKDYREFVESSRGKIFTAHIERKFVSLNENDNQWLFWPGNLIIVEEKGDNDNERGKI